MATKKQDQEPEEEPRSGQYASLPGEYECPHCGGMIVHGSKPGIEEACIHCGERSVVPEPSE